MESNQQPVACSLGRDHLARRQERWLSLAARTPAQVSRADQGLRLTFGAAAGVAEELWALVALERECCAFADWSLHTGPAGHVLDISGGTPEAVAAIQEMFTGPGTPFIPAG